MTRNNIIHAVAGLMILTGLALAYWLHPNWILLPAFVGFNLLQSAFSGFCPLEIMLRRAAIGREG